MPATRIILAPGASGTIEGLRGHERGLVARGLDVRLVELPKGRAERAVPVYGAALDSEDAAATVVGGHSYGGRVASLLSAERPVAGLVLLSYPLHAPGRQEAWDERTAHWPRIACPVLILSGESDPFANLVLLQRAVERLPRATLVTYPGVGHGLGPVLDRALEEIADFMHRHT
ncbi:MAG: alpha/beta hydrolase family protein [Candidatus Limnocylindria bacterium]